ncbi:MAG: MBL fold metallo-hydrolase [Coriobacteriales bacterium]|nr:MBL fold metallo-hydrolase [Coriobacteriales bacterium]
MTGTTRSSRMRLTVLGARGSVSVSGASYAAFGGATSCYAVQAGDELIILDAGTGIVHAPAVDVRQATILVSHLHLDHLEGLGMYERLSRLGARTMLYLPVHSNQQALEALERLYSPPLWPLKLTEYGGELVVRAMPHTLRIGEVVATTIEGNHPGGCRVIKLCHNGQVIVYATDYEYEPSSFSRLAEFSRDADLLLFDAQYSDEQLRQRAGFGHSSADIGLELQRQSGAKHLLLTHHDPHSTDAMLAARERALLPFPHASYAREGEVIEL